MVAPDGLPGLATSTKERWISSADERAISRVFDVCLGAIATRRTGGHLKRTILHLAISIAVLAPLACGDGTPISSDADADAGADAGATCGPLPCGSGANATCVDTATDRANCGSCGHACDPGSVCAAGSCALTCGALTTCGSGASTTCVNTATDSANCGSCGHACARGELCTDGDCVPPPPYCSGARLTAAPFAGGTGTREDPFTICTAEQLAKVGTQNMKAFVLERDIDLDGAQITELSLDTGGFFDGKNHVVRNWVDNHEATTGYDRAGLFTVVSNAEIRNLGVENFTVTATVNNGDFFFGGVGGLAGAAFGSRIVNCHASSGTVDHKSIWYAGVLVGWSHDTVYSRSYASGTITAPNSFCGKGGAFIGGDGNGYGSILITDSWAVASPEADAGLAPCFGGGHSAPLILDSFIKEANGSYTVYDSGGHTTQPPSVSSASLAPLGFDFNKVWQNGGGGAVLQPVLLTDTNQALSLKYTGNGALAAGQCLPFTVSLVSLAGAAVNAPGALEVGFFGRDEMVVYPNQAACNAGNGSVTALTIPAGQSSVQMYAKLASLPAPGIFYSAAPDLSGLSSSPDVTLAPAVSRSVTRTATSRRLSALPRALAPDPTPSGASASRLPAPGPRPPS